jgi:hypothetical protein
MPRSLSHQLARTLACQKWFICIVHRTQNELYCNMDLISAHKITPPNAERFAFITTSLVPHHGFHKFHDSTRRTTRLHPVVLGSSCPASHNNTPTASPPHTPILCPPRGPTLNSLLIVNHVLWFNRHVHHIRHIACRESIICFFTTTVSTQVYS